MFANKNYSKVEYHAVKLAYKKAYIPNIITKILSLPINNRVGDDEGLNRKYFGVVVICASLD